MLKSKEFKLSQSKTGHMKSQYGMEDHRKGVIKLDMKELISSKCSNNLAQFFPITGILIKDSRC